jgi:hypothetical protein
MYRYILIPAFLVFTLFGVSFFSTDYSNVNYRDRLDYQEIPNDIIPSGIVENVDEVSQNRIQTDLQRLALNQSADGDCYHTP